MEPKLTEKNIKKYFEETTGFSKYNNYHLEKLTKEETILTAVVDENATNPSGIAHGGFIFGLADTAMGVMAYLSGKKVVTIDTDIHYLKPCTGPNVKCVATPVKIGKTIGVYEAKVYNGNELAATLSGSYFFLDREIKK